MLYLRELLRNNRGFTIVEVLSVAFILTVLFAGIFVTLTTGELSNQISAAKADLQANVRTAMNSLTKDLRQTSAIQINSNDPSAVHIKFKKVSGIDNFTGDHSFSDNTIEYSYNAATLSLTRNEFSSSGALLKQQVFNNITEAPFYSSQGVPLAPGAVLTTRKLVIVISARETVRGSLNINFTITEEIKIRNG